MIPNIVINLSGDIRAVARITKVRDSVRDSVRERVRILTDALYDRVRENLSGGILKIRTGNLLDHLEKIFLESATAITGQVRIRGVPYAAIQDLGGVTAPHVIAAINRTAVSFDFHGYMAAFAYVNHPGSRITPSGYLSGEVTNERDIIIASLTGAVREGVSASNA